MDYRDAFAISASGLDVEKLRLDATAANLANMHASSRPGTARYQPLQVVVKSGASFAARFDQIGQPERLPLAGAPVARLETAEVPPRLAYDPGHPDADERGMVAYPGVDHVREMINLSTALRAYQANVLAMNAAKTMAVKALEIGG